MPANPSKKMNRFNSSAVKVALCGFVSYAFYFIMVALFAALALKHGMNSSSYMPAGCALSAVSGFINGFVVAVLIKEKGALYGLISGVVQSVFCVITLFLFNGGAAGKGLLIVAALITVFSTVGGVAGVNFKLKKKY